MYYSVLAIQCIGILIMFIECYIVMGRWRGMLHSWLFFSCITTLVNSMGYLFQLLSKTFDSYLVALKLSYLGRVWIAFALIMFAVTLCGKKLPKAVPIVISFVHVATYIVVLTAEKHSLYYKNIMFANGGLFPKMTYKSGIWHTVFTILIMCYVAFGLVSILRTRAKEKNPIARRRLLMVVLAIVVQGTATGIQMFKLIPITYYYDITMPAYVLGAVFMLIAILRYRLLDTKTLARDYVVEELSEGIIAVDVSGSVKYYNKPVLDIFPEIETDENGVLRKIHRALEHDDELYVNDRIFSPQKNVLYQDGFESGSIYSLTDETEHFRYMKELEKQTDIAARANHTKSLFLANMSHEIRTPINAILGMDEMILRESEEKETIEYASDIRDAGRTLLSIINGILDFSKVEEGRMEIVPTQYELCSMINDLVNMIQPRAEKKGLITELNVDKDIPHYLVGDEIRLRQCALNILTNAVKYTEKGKVVFDLNFRKISDKKISLIFHISDTGIGMKEDDMNKLFSPFERIEESRNRKIEGTGLGMSIVKELLKLMGSELIVKSVYGEGSEFTFEVEQEVTEWEPLGDYVPRFMDQRKKGNVSRELFHAPDAHILVVDDNEVNLSVATNLLKRTKIQVDTAVSGEEAIEKVLNNKYDVVFVDHMMPDMDGIETLKKMKSLTEDVPICIALTANAVSGARQTYIGAGFVDYLSKPIDSERLEEMLKKYIPDEKLLDVDDRESEEASEDDDRTRDGSGSEDSPGADNSDGLPEWLYDISELDVGEGIKNGGSEAGYFSILTVFHQTAADKADELEKLLGDGDIENYTIKVHALKSSARVVGAAEISELARKLEEAGKTGDTEFINEHNDELLGMYRALDEKLKPMDEKGEDLPDISESQMKDAYMTMTEIAGSFDYGLMEDLIKELRGYALPDKDRERIDRIEKRLMELDWNGIESILKEDA